MGADAQTVEQSVATPIEQQMSGVDNMNYMYSLNAGQWSDDDDGRLRRQDRPQHRSDPDPDAGDSGGIAAPAEVVNYGITVQKSLTAPIMVIALNSPQRHL